MKHKSIKEEIFILLKNSPLHQRELARVLKTNQTNVRRALIDLEKGNLVDKKNVGKSKVYFTKDSLEALIYERIVENYKLMKILEKPAVRNVFREIQNKISSKKIKSQLIIVLFGSYAKNLEAKNSDIDIYINSTSKEDKKIIEEISNKINIVGLADKGTPLFNEIKKDYIILNNIEDFLNLLR